MVRSIASSETILAAAPKGSQVTRFPRKTDLLGNFVQTFCALFYGSYFFFGPIIACVLGALCWFQWLSGQLIVGLLVVYFAQIVLYRPHLSTGWPAFLLYSRMVDFALHYYDAVCLREGPAPDPNKRYLFACYPHGVYGVCRAFSGGVENWGTLYPGIKSRWGSFGLAFYMPGVREISLMSGCLDAGKPTMTAAIQQHRQNVTLLPGGIDEMQITDGTSQTTQLVMEDRKGYAKLAIETGCDLVPGFCFGEKWIHENWLLPRWLRALLYKTMRMSGVILKGRGLTFLGYLGVPLGFVWGAPIKVKQQNPVDPAYLNQVHAEMQSAVRSIFDRHKINFGYSKEESLEFVTVAEARRATREQGKKDS